MTLRMRPFFFQSGGRERGRLAELLEQDLHDALQLALLGRRKMIRVRSHDAVVPFYGLRCKPMIEAVPKAPDRPRAGPAGPRSGGRRLARGVLRVGAERPAAIDDVDAPLLGLDDQALEHAVAGESDDIARASSASICSLRRKPARAPRRLSRPKATCGDLAALGPGGGEAVDALAVAAMDEDHVGDALAHLVERLPDIVGEASSRSSASRKGQPPAGEHDRAFPRGMAARAPRSRSGPAGSRGRRPRPRSGPRE